MDLITYALCKGYIEASLAGAGALQGNDGKSAYEIAIDNGFIGTEQDWLESLIGPSGITPHIGENGNWFLGETDTKVKANGVISYNDLEDKPTLNGEIIQGDIKSGNLFFNKIDNQNELLIFTFSKGGK